MNGKEFEGNQLFVDAAKTDRRRGDRNRVVGPQQQDECWHCGKKGHW